LNFKFKLKFKFTHTTPLFYTLLGVRYTPPYSTLF
jgi:hypothetical protein